MTQWTDERIGTLTRLWSEGVSAGNIAIALKTDRNAVIGKIHRLGLPVPANKQPYKRGRHTVAPGRTKSAAKRVHLKRFINHGNRFDVTDDVQPALPVLDNGLDTPAAQRCTLLQLKPGICKWPFGEPQLPGFFFCGGDAVEGMPYCAGHCRVAYRDRAA